MDYMKETNLRRHMRELLIRSSIFVFFALLFIGGILIFGDYGMSYDEAHERSNGRLQVAYSINYLSHVRTPDMDRFRTNYGDRYYGIGLQIPQVFLEAWCFGQTGNEAGRSIWLLRHMFNWCYFYLAAIFLYLLGKRLWQHRGYALLAVVLLLACPRIFTEAFVGVKDGGFLASMIIAMYFYVRFLDRPGWRSGLLLGLFAGFATAVRFLAVEYMLLIMLFMFLRLLAERKFLRVELVGVGVALMSYCLCVFSLYPLAWGHVFTFFPEMLRYMSHHPWGGSQLFMGAIYRGSNIPWYYLPVWLGVSIPLILQLVALFGLVLLACQAGRGLLARNISPAIMVKITLVLMVVLPVAAVMIMHSTLYSGWRQFYFLWLPLVLASVYGLKYLHESFWSRHRVLVCLVWLVMVANGVNLTVWMVRNHPYQNNYFNVLAGNAALNFEREGCLENYHCLNYLAALEQNNPEYISVAGVANVYLNIQFLSDNIRKRFVMPLKIDRCRYFLNTPRSDDPATVAYILAKRQLIYQIEVDDSLYIRKVPILQIYR